MSEPAEQIKRKVDGKLGRYLINPSQEPKTPGLTVAFNEDGSVYLGIFGTPHGFLLSWEATEQLRRLLNRRYRQVENCFHLAG